MMKSPKYFLFFVIFIITLFFNLLLLVRQRNYKNAIKENVKAWELLDAKGERALFFLNHYNKICKLKILDTINVIHNDGVQTSLKEIIESKNKLIIWFSVNSCANCYLRELEKLRSLAKEIGEGRVVYLVSGFTSNRAFTYFIDELNITENIYYIENNFLTDNTLTNSDIPFLFITDSSFQVCNIYLIDKLLPNDLTLNYLNFVTKKYFTSSR